jgi:acyl dehydratase
MARLLFPLAKYYMTSKELRMNLLKMVHGQQSVRWLSPLRVGDALSITAKIDSIIDTTAGQMLNLKMEGSVDGRPCVELLTSFMVRGTGTMKDQSVRADEPASGRELFRRDFLTFEGQQLRYASVSGDRNFVHTSNFLARMAGLRRTIMHGVCLLAMATNTIMDEVLDGDISRMKGVSVRFAKPVYPGERVTVIGYESGKKGQVLFEAVTESGKLCMKNGNFSFK